VHFFFLTIGVAGGGPLRAEAAESETLSIEVHFQDYAGIPDSLLRKAARVAAQAYEPAGVAIEWLDCTPVLRGLPAPEGCGGETRATSLIIQLVSEKMAKAVPVPKSVFGYATPVTSKRFSNRAILFADRIRDHCEAFGLDAAVLLGMAIAHEIGHLLLERPGHGASGLMRCPWKRRDVVDAARGRLSFTSDQLALLHEGAVARSRTNGLWRGGAPGDSP
jgi:hypothetical protein